MTTSAAGSEPAATLANWRTPPFNRRAFRQIDQLLPTALIARGSEPARLLPQAPQGPQALAGFSLPVAGGGRLDLEGFLRQTHTDGLLVLHHGAVACQWLDDGMSARTEHIVMSATKSVIGLLAGVLAGHGLLDTEAPVSRYLPQLAGTGYADATVRQLLDMLAQPQLDEHDLLRYAAATGWDPLPTGTAATSAAATGGWPAGLHEFFSRLPARQASHGGPFRYQSANTDLLGWVLECAGGKPLAELLSQHLWQPMGAGCPARITVDHQGAARATGGLCASLEDFARIGQLVLDGGRGPTGQVVPGAWIDDIADNGDRRAWAGGDFAQAFAGMAMHYRSGWYVIDDAPQTLFAMGIHGQNLFVDRTNGLMIAKLSSQPLPLDPKAISLTLRAVAQIRRCLAN